MRFVSLSTLAVVSALLLLPVSASGQGRRPLVHSVTLRPDTNIITISGSGLGPELLVTVDGQPVTTLGVATDTQLEVMAPTTVQTVPGAYRLTVVDMQRQFGDAFVVVSPGRTASDGVLYSQALGAWASSTLSAQAGAWERTDKTNARPDTSSIAKVSSSAIEDVNNTAFGLGALASLTTGVGNSAFGGLSLTANTWGAENTASGAAALGANISGWRNTATGSGALRLNEVGNDNTAVGFEALRQNVWGTGNTAIGKHALFQNVGTTRNTAIGFEALVHNDLADGNVAIGYQALRGLSRQGGFNIAIGSGAGSTLDEGTSNIYIGPNVSGVGIEQMTTRIGKNQLRAFMSGIYGSALTGPAVQVFVDANGQLGTITAPASGSGTTAAPGVARPDTPADAQTMASLQARVAQLEALVQRLLAQPRR